MQAGDDDKAIAGRGRHSNRNSPPWRADSGKPFRHLLPQLPVRVWLLCRKHETGSMHHGLHITGMSRRQCTTRQHPSPISARTVILVLPLVQASEGAAARRPSLPQVAAQGPAWSGTPGGCGRGDAVSRWPLPVLSGESLPLPWLPCWDQALPSKLKAVALDPAPAHLLLLLRGVDESYLQRQEEPFASRYPLNVSNQSGVLHWIESMLTHLAPPGIKLDMVQIRQEATRGSSEGACAQCAAHFLAGQGDL